MKKHRFIPPRIDNFPDDIEGTRYYDIRNWVLVNKVIPRGQDAVFHATLCESCGMVFNNPRFTEDELKHKYAIFEGLNEDDKAPSCRVLKKENQRGERILKEVESHNDKDSMFHVLDYGGADGSVLGPFAAAGYNCDLVDYARYDLPDGIRYVGEDHQDLERDKSYGLILCIHVLEHVPYPVELLSDIVSHLDEDGLVNIEVPLGCWREWRAQKEPLTHLNFFSEESVFNLLSKAGLFPIWIKTRYQYVLGNTIWCVNAFASKKPRQTRVGVKPTKKQIGRPYYYISPFAANPIETLKKLYFKFFRL